MSSKQHFDVAIVGAGPVGMTLALLLAQSGHEVAIYDRWMAPFPLPRAVGMSHDTLRTIQSAGLLDKVHRHLEIDMKNCTTGEWFTPDGEVLMRQVVEPTGDSGFPPMIGFNQPDIEGELNQACLNHPMISMERGWEATSLSQSPDQATLVLAPVDGENPREGEPITVSAKFVIGCDGTNSFVRSNMNINIHDTGFESRWLVIDLKPDAEALKAFPYELAQTMETERPTTIVTGGPGRRRFEIMIHEDESSEKMIEPEMVWSQMKRWGFTPDNSELVRAVDYTFNGRWGDNWRDGRILLAGDAAHQMPPFMSQGMNSGIRDSATLAWMLDRVLNGAPLEFLDHYTNERLPHVRSIIEQSVMFGQLICITDPEAAERRNAMLRAARDNPELAPPPPPPWRFGPGIWESDSEHTGFVGVQAEVKYQNQSSLLENFTGGGWHLIGNGFKPTEHLNSDTKAFWSSLNGHSIDIGPQATYQDVNNRYGEWFTKLEACAVLVRPDFCIYGVASAEEDIQNLVSGLRGRLNPQ